MRCWYFYFIGLHYFLCINFENRDFVRLIQLFICIVRALLGRVLLNSIWCSHLTDLKAGFKIVKVFTLIKFLWNIIFNLNFWVPLEIGFLIIYFFICLLKKSLMRLLILNRHYRELSYLHILKLFRVFDFIL